MRYQVLILTADTLFGRMLQLEFEGWHLTAGLAAGLTGECADVAVVDLDSAPVPPDAIQSYSGENAAPVAVDDEALTALGVSVLRAEVSGMKGRFVRHDPQALAAALMDFYRRNATTRVFG